MEDALNDSHGLAHDAGTLGADVEIVAAATGFSNDEIIKALEELGRCMAELCKNGKLANRAFIEMHPYLLSMKADPDFLPRKIKKAYWKLFDNGRLTWRERNKLLVWCKNNNITLDKLSGKQVTA